MTWKQWAEDAHPVLHAAYKANKNHGVPEEWFAGLVAVECARLDPRANRFEPHVYRELVRVNAGRGSYLFPGFETGRLGAYIKAPGRMETELRMLATSYGLGQIMGYHYLNKWGMEPPTFTHLSVNDSTMYTLRMMAEGMGWARKWIQVQASPQPWGRQFELMIRWWNTGQVLGKPYSSDYVVRAANAREHYKEVMGRHG
jgi:hypothetical protein